MTRLGLFSTLTGAGSRVLVERIAGASAAGRLGEARVAFLFVNREAGESEVTDESVASIRGDYDFPVVRASAVRFRADERKAARRAAAAGEGDEALWAWRDAFYESYRDRLADTAVDVLLGDMWIWGRRACAERRGLNLHPALPGGPIGKMWFDVIWDLVAAGATESGVMLHRVTPEVDLGPVVAFCRYPLRGPGLDDLWAALPVDPAARRHLVAVERARKRGCDHPLFVALRAQGLAREVPIMLEAVRAVAEGRLGFAGGGVVDAAGDSISGGLDLTGPVEARLAADS